jgi:anti-sigma regulatory factor (Ser/Thr protein kinase)
MLGDSIEDNEVIHLMRNNQLNHVITTGDESELVTTSSKLISGDIFGLDKYLSWGAKLHTTPVVNYEDKRRAIAEVAAYATEVGARRRVMARIESVVDELLMNAIYDAPDAAGAARSGAAQLEYGCDGRYFAVSVSDNYGLLSREVILDNLLRAREERGRPRQSDKQGAGLGLYFVLSSVTRFIANIEEGRRTEVIGLFDLRQSGREAGKCASSLHIFDGAA